MGQGCQVGRGIEVLGEGDSMEVRGLQAALKEARRAAQDKPLAAQVEECQAFIQRSQRRLEKLEEERAKEQEELDAAQRRMARFREEMARAMPTISPPVSETTQPGQIPACGRARTSEGTSQRDGDRARGGSEETLQISVGPFSRPRWWTRFVVAGVGRSTTNMWGEAREPSWRR